MTSYTGINIQWPISEKIISGAKSIETRTYPIPKKFVGIPLAIIETPGPKGSFKARVVALVVFEDAFKYSSAKEFYKDTKRHLVEPDSPWKWTSKGKWGWPIRKIEVFATFKEAPLKKGIIFTNNVRIST